MKKILDVFNPVSLNKKSLIKFCFQTFLVTTIAGIVVTALTQGLMQTIGIKNIHQATGAYGGVNIRDFFGVVIFAPIIETFILGLLIKTVSFLSTRKIITCCISAVVIAFFHWIENGIYNFFGPLILFFSFSYSFIAWQPHSYRFAYISACVPHVLNNLVSFLLISLLLLV